MKVLMVVQGFGDKQYGVERIVENIALNMAEHDAEVHIVTMIVDGTIHSRLELNVSRVRYWARTGQMLFHPLQYSEVKALIRKIEPDVVHCHGCLSFLQRSAILAARNLGCGSILVSTHGMLEPWMWRQKGEVYYRLKRLYWRSLMKPVLKQANYMHAITPLEAETLHVEFPAIPQVRIPNAIEMANYAEEQKEPDAERYLLFLGRLHPVKGVDMLIEAYARSKVDGIRLIIAGPEFDAAYTRKLMAMVERLGVSERVSFIGPVYGEAKQELLKGAWCTVVPSHSEVVAMVNLESAASFTPTITTTMTGLPDWQDGGGLLVEPEIEPLSEAIDKVCNWSLVERMDVGKRVRGFVAQRYSWDVIGPQWMDTYCMIAAGDAQDG